jgi:hypothetical protein
MWGEGGQFASRRGFLAKLVMPGQKRVFALDVPGICALVAKKGVDGRDKPGHDEKRFIFRQPERA